MLLSLCSAKAVNLLMLINREPDAIFHPSFGKQRKRLIEAFNHTVHCSTTHVYIAQWARKRLTRLRGPQLVVWNGVLRYHLSLQLHKHSCSQWIPVFGRLGHLVARCSTVYGIFSLIWQVRFKLGSSDDEEDEEDSDEQPHSEQDLCHPLCQCDKCSKWQKVSGNLNKKMKGFFP